MLLSSLVVAYGSICVSVSIVGPGGESLKQQREGGLLYWIRWILSPIVKEVQLVCVHLPAFQICICMSTQEDSKSPYASQV